MRKIAQSALTLACLIGSGAAFSKAPEISGRVGTEYVSWREYSDYGGEQLLEERGGQVFAELGLSVPLTSRTDFRVKGRLYGGNILYDGQYQDGTPATATTEYRGITGEVGVAYTPMVRHMEGAPALILNLGADRWDRTIAGSGGYQEQYRLIFLRMGVDREASTGKWSGRGGVLFPLEIQEEVMLYDGVSLKPEGKPSFYFGVGYRLMNGMEVNLDYQGYRFDASDLSSRPVTSGGVPVDIDNDGSALDYVYQPKSDMDRVGLSLRWRF